MNRAVLNNGLRYSWAVVLCKDVGFKFHMKKKRTMMQFKIVT